MEYKELGARLTKWRAVVKIGHQISTSTCIAANVNLLACFAALSLEAGLLPLPFGVQVRPPQRNSIGKRVSGSACQPHCRVRLPRTRHRDIGWQGIRPARWALRCCNAAAGSGGMLESIAFSRR